MTIVFAVIAMMALSEVHRTRAAANVLNDGQLLRLAHDTYLRGDWIYAALHANALIQRDPQLLRDDPAFANELQDALVFSIGQLEEQRRLSQIYVQTQGRSESNGVASVSSKLEAQPPRVNWPAAARTP